MDKHYTDLIYDKYKAFEIRYKEMSNGFQHLFGFPNGYGASVVKHDYSYGASRDLFELAVIRFTEDGWYITYSTPITDDVIGYLTNEQVLKLLKRIKLIRKNWEETV